MASAPISILISAKAYEHLRAECAISPYSAMRAIGYGLVGSPFVTASCVRIVLAEQDARRLLAEVPVCPTLRDPLSQIACILNNRDSRRPLVRTGYPEVGSFVG